MWVGEWIVIRGSQHRLNIIPRIKETNNGCQGDIMQSFSKKEKILIPSTVRSNEEVYKHPWTPKVSRIWWYSEEWTNDMFTCGSWGQSCWTHITGSGGGLWTRSKWRGGKIYRLTGDFSQFVMLRTLVDASSKWKWQISLKWLLLQVKETNLKGIDSKKKKTLWK